MVSENAGIWVDLRCVQEGLEVAISGGGTGDKKYRATAFYNRRIPGPAHADGPTRLEALRRVLNEMTCKANNCKQPGIWREQFHQVLCNYHHIMALLAWLQR